jgi:hypothetical protein
VRQWTREARRGDIQVEMEMDVARHRAAATAAKWLRAGYPTVAPSSEIYAESWVNRPGQSAL